MQKLQIKARHYIIQKSIWFVVICFAVEILMFVILLFTNQIHRLPYYCITRILVPTLSNIVVYTLLVVINRSKRIRHSVKNNVTAYGFVTMIGGVSVHHAYFITLWVVPAFCLLVCSLLVDRKSLRNVLIYIYMLLVISVGYIIWEYPKDFLFYVENGFVASICIFILYYYIGKYNAVCLEAIGILKKDMQQKLAYERRIHYDYLTNVYSKEYIIRTGCEAMGHCNEDNPVCVAVIDIDDFGGINDRYGFADGDVVLQTFANRLNAVSGEDFIAGRFEGEKFIVIMKHSAIEECSETINNISRDFAAQRYEFSNTPVSFSCGFVYSVRYIPFDDMLEHANSLLYEAKRSGKNQIKSSSI